MCLIIFAPKINRARIQKAVLERAFHRNNDGGGLAYIEDGKIKVSKPFFAFDEYFLEYQRVRSRIHTGPLLMHMRRGTGGSNNHTNTQPLVIYRGRLVMAHNGVFHRLTSQEDISDSVVLARQIRKMGWNYPFIKAQNDLLTMLCDESSKLVFMNDKGRHTIINESAGKWWHGAWYSNDMFVGKKPKYAESSRSNYGMYPRYPGDTDYEIPPLVKVSAPMPKCIPPGTRYAKMTPAERLEYDVWKDRLMEREPEAPAQFRRHSVIKPIPEQEFGPNTDPDMLSGEDFQAWQEWRAVHNLIS